MTYRLLTKWNWVVALPLFAALMVSPPAAGQGFLDQLQGELGGGAEDGNVSVSAQFTPATAGRPAVVIVTANVSQGWHIYSITQEGGGPQKTTLTLKPSDSFKQLGQFRSTPAPHTYVDQEIFTGVTIEEHEGKVTWYAPVEFAEGVNPETATITAVLDYQRCSDIELGGGCVSETKEIEARLGPGVPIGELDFTSPVLQPTEPVATEGPAIASSGTPYDLSSISIAALGAGGGAGGESLVYYLFWAFIGGFILNLMPCVLPVIGLKVMSFVQQAGYSRGKALTLNLWYSLGIIVVFWVLAALAVFAGVGWGGLFSSVGFNIAMASIVFVMALSLLGVWEIHVPDAVNRSATHDVVQQEGVLGAFFKGVMTTLLATPCTGPGMAVALGWAVKQPSITVLAVFSAIGFGMASPYLVIGAYPQLVNFLPRPGNWMVTFKQLMGFVLMGTVIYLLALVDANYLLPTLTLLVVLGLACWVYSLTPANAPMGERSQTYALTSAIVAAGAVFAFGWLAPLLQSEQSWQDFSLAKLKEKAIDEQKTVLVDFSADWCATCKVLEKTVLHTEPVEQAIKLNGVVTMYGDNTKHPPEIKQTINALGSEGVPVIAIFPGGAPYEPIVFRGIYTQQQLLDAIQQASSAKATRGEKLTRTAAEQPAAVN